MADGARFVVFDLDGVLTTHDTMGHFGRSRLGRKPARLAVAIPFLLLTRVHALPAVSAWAAGVVTRITLGAMPHADYVAEADAVGSALATVPGFVMADGVAALRAHVDAGDTVVICTGSEVSLIRGFLRELDLGDVTLYSSEFAHDGRRVVMVRHNVGRVKVETLASLGLPIAEAIFYTDSVADLPLARVAAHTHLINPDGRTRRAFERQVPSLTVHAWT